jgi:hypothetical protein
MARKVFIPFFARLRKLYSFRTGRQRLGGVPLEVDLDEPGRTPQKTGE